MRLALLVIILPGLSMTAEIPQGAHALLRLVNSVSTRTAREGDYVYLRTATPVVVNGQIVVPAESYVQGVVSHAQRSGRVKGRAELGIRIETLTLASGKVVQVAPHLASVDSEGSDQKVVTNENQVQQGSNRGSDAARIATLSGTGAAIGGLADSSWKGAGIGAGAGGAVGLASVLLTRGREVELRQGSTIDYRKRPLWLCTPGPICQIRASRASPAMPARGLVVFQRRQQWLGAPEAKPASSR